MKLSFLHTILVQTTAALRMVPTPQSYPIHPKSDVSEWSLNVSAMSDRGKSSSVVIHEAATQNKGSDKNTKIKKNFEFYLKLTGVKSSASQIRRL
jgi:hypothetical protein